MTLPQNDLLGVTALLLTCSYNSKEFIRIGQAKCFLFALANGIMQVLIGSLILPNHAEIVSGESF